MTVARTDVFTEEYVEMSEFANALAHPARIAIVTFLQAKDRVSFKEIVSEIPLAQATISQHIKTLLDVGLISQYPRGARMDYALNCEKVLNFCDRFQCTLENKTPEK